MLLPAFAICCEIVACAPWPMLTMAITAPTPMIMPSMVSVDRSLFRPSALSAILKVMSHIDLPVARLRVLPGSLIRHQLAIFKVNLPLRISCNVRLVGHKHNGHLSF